jgi:hypothetical protein
MSENIERLTAQAEKCLRLAMNCPTASVAKSLMALADDYLERAANLQSEAQQPASVGGLAV